jgi:CRP-like cAMP-binding protein
MSAFNNETNTKILSSILKEIAKNMFYVNIPQNKIIVRNEEIGDKFYIILKGKVGFCIVKNIKCYLNEEEYVTFLLQLKKNNENELLKRVIRENKQIFEIKDNFDLYIEEMIQEYEKNRGNGKISFELYTKLIEVQKCIKYNIDHFGHNVTPNLYINSNKIKNDKLPAKNRKQVTIPEYEYINSFESGQTFGHVALESKTQKRTATAITLEECHLGYLNKNDYLVFVKEITTKAHQNLCNLIFSYSLFNEIPKKIFETNYIHMFKYTNFERNEKIINEGEPSNHCLFLNSGQIIISVNKNVEEVNELIIKLKQIKSRINKLTKDKIDKYITEIKENEELKINKKFLLDQHKKIIEEKNNIIITYVQNRDIFGLSDMLDPIDNKTSLFDVVCSSYKCDAYYLDRHGLSIIGYREIGVRTEIRKLCNLQLDYYIERLIGHKNEIMKKIKKMENYYFMQFKENEKNEFVSKNQFNSGNKNNFVDNLKLKNAFQIEKNLKLPDINLNNKNNNNNNYFSKIKKQIEEKTLLLENAHHDKIYKHFPHEIKSMRKKEISLDKYKYLINEKNRYDNIFNALLKDRKNLYLKNNNSFSSDKKNNKNTQNEILQTENNINSNNSLRIFKPITINKKNNIKNENENNKSNKENSLQKSTINHKRNFSTNIPTNYSNYPSYINTVNFIDCLIMDKFNKYYSLGLLNNSRNENIKNNYLYNNNSFTSI